MSGFNDELSKLLPSSFGSKKAPSTEKTASSTNNSDWDALKSFLPTSFGKQEKKKDMTKEFEKTKRQAVTVPKKEQANRIELPTPTAESNTANQEQNIQDDEEEESEGIDDSEDDEIDYTVPPTTHEVQLKDHFRTVSALALDPSGSRLISGGYDYQLKFWDFAGMNNAFRPFRSMEPCGGHQIHQVLYSLTGDSFLVISGSARAKLFNRDGGEIREFAKGDPYIRDLRHTDGHVGALTSGAWHPIDRQTFATSSQDGTIRVWDVENKRKQRSVIAYKSRERGGRSAATALAYSCDAKLIAGAFQDGTLNLWNVNGPFVKPSLSVPDAHQKTTETSSIIFSRNGHTMVTRGGDDTVKLWDIRNIKKPLRVAYNLDIVNPEANVIFSPDERLILTGTSVPKGQGNGRLVMLDRETLDVKHSLDVGQSSVVKVLWHPRINQIITGSADGTINMFYSPTHSFRGAKLCVVREAKQRAVDDYEVNRPIITPHALPMFKDDQPRSSKRKREKLRKDPKASHRPELPVKGPGKGGRVGMNEQQVVIASFGKDTTRDEDPREALLKYADAAANDPMWVSNVYKKTQPKPVFTHDDEDEEPQGKRKK
ncbi:hypothetical protein EC973_003238 [Apophysomyces ossiformis]|uniref:WD40 repeat-like protein n=1 Tax=Apophysomyces ossiformis TaxID=679940 RepID=A0A8H7ETQ6_9FUNG|nr:hypothetical protein EC973_003238 [Apophysomyces ossiformis]